MVVLGIETSCDETAAAVVAETGDAMRPWAIRSNVVASQAAIHREWGGVVPELASRQHIRDICGVVDKAMKDGGIDWPGLDAIAVTQGPGLVGSLLVGVAFAKSLALARGLPLVPVHHLAGHIESLTLQNGELPLPAVVLVVSGGHTSLYHVARVNDYRLIGRTRDDAAGEAYDKVAKLLGLGYPGGPIIDRLARQGDDRAVAFPVARMTHLDRNAPPGASAGGRLPKALEGRTDFSFSGLKTAVARYVQARQRTGLGGGVRTTEVMRHLAGAGRSEETEGHLEAAGRTTEGGRRLADREIADVCASFQRAVIEALLDRTFWAARWFGARSVGIAGGVSANSRLRQDAEARGAALGLPVYLPSLALATDNAAMIAAAGLRRYRAGTTGTLDLSADASLPMTNDQ